MSLYFYFNETTGDLVYSDQATYGVDGYVSLGQQTNMAPTLTSDWVFNSRRSAIVTVSKDKSIVGKIAGLTSMYYMFHNCDALTSLDLSGFDTSAVTNMADMFYVCDNLRLIAISDRMSNILSQLPTGQYYPAAGGSPVAKADLTAGTWVRDEADLTKVTSIVQQAQMSQAISRRIGGVRRDLEAQIRKMSARLSQLEASATADRA